MLEVPEDTPVTTPEVLTVATEGAVELQVPPVLPPTIDKFDVLPEHKEVEVAAMVPGFGLTVTFKVAAEAQPPKVTV